MAHTERVTRLTPEEYLALDRSAQTRHEYVNGELYAMAGASRVHNLMVTNLVRNLGNQLQSGRCEIYANDMRVEVTAADDYLFADIVVVCGAPELREDAFLDTLLNPVLIIEVLSPSTKDYDRGEKWEKYRQIPSLQEYLMLAQDRPHVEGYLRQSDPFWLYGATTGLNHTIELGSIGCTLALTDVYGDLLDAKTGVDTRMETENG